MSRLEQVANEIVAPGKGILAADESTPTIAKRFKSIDVESTETTRRDYRELLFRTAGAAAHISGVILYDETLRQDAADGTPLRELLSSQGVHPGIKVDMGTRDLPGHPDEMFTQGLTGLRERLAEYAELGATFAKWRAVYTIAHARPTSYLMRRNARDLASYAALCQEQGLVPIVEPEVLMDGEHGIERCARVTERVLTETYHALYEAGVALEGTLLKPNMICPGADNPQGKASPEQVAEWTVRVLRRAVPTAVPGIVFLSGGQTEEEATANLNAMNALGSHPWQLSYSYGRALQASALQAWKGESANTAAAQAAYLHRSKMNGLARTGEYRAEMEKELAGV